MLSGGTQKSEHQIINERRSVYDKYNDENDQVNLS
jgi:hypothetical protein